jgi:hypothetical protein
MSSTRDEPLPGDLVICDAEPIDASSLRHPTCVVTVWPSNENIGGPYQSYGYALIQARVLAARRGVRVFRRDSTDGRRSEFEEVG